MSHNEFKTFGCRLNIFETDRMQRLASEAGLDNVILFNSCGVTNEAVRQVRQSIRKAHRNTPDKPIIVTGCAAQMHPEMFADMPEVAHVIGNANKLSPKTFETLARQTAGRVDVPDIMEADGDETATTGERFFDTSFTDPSTHGKTRAFLAIQNGCDHRCTFCIIPFGRGPSRSVPAAKIIDNVKQTVQQGVHEIVLTGVDITDYKNFLSSPHARGTEDTRTLTLGLLVQKILQEVPDLPRLRLSSIDAVEIDPALEDALESEDRLMPHLHLSLQSGDDMILKRMKRRHLRDDALELCRNLRTKRKDLVFGADLIAGFPTETKEMFNNTLRLIDECELTFLHVFPFSPRQGTPAARMPQLDRSTIKQRAKTLREKGRECLQHHFQNACGKICEVLMETQTSGRTPWFSEVTLSRPVPAGSLQQVKITGFDTDKLTGGPC